MNMDELFKNIWASEEGQAMAPNNDSGVTNNVNLQKQGSLTVPRTHSQKTVDEVWKEVLKENGGFKESNLQPQDKQPALGEMTLEEFLQKTGVVSENGQSQQFAVVTDGKTEVNNLQGVRSSQQPNLKKILPKHAGFNFTSSMNLVKEAQMGSSVNGVSICAKIDYPRNLVNEAQLGSGVSGVSLIRTSDNPTKGSLRPRSSSDLFPNDNLDTSPSPRSYAYGSCGRNWDGSLEKVVERRRKRMIKNRESAARSRARKQAYTLELEAEVAKLKQLNHELQKKQEEIMESHNFQVPEKMKLQGNRKSCLRRTLTAPW